jgi:hypothetical protein
MANTPEGTPYVESSDLVANYPAASLALANRVDLVGVLPFANAAARTTAIPSPTDGQYSYLQDTNSTEFWDGAAWVKSGGKIMQVVSTAKTDTFSTTATTFTAVTGLSATITPTSSTSRIFVMVSFFHGQDFNASQIAFDVRRGSSSVFIGDASGSRTSATGTAYHHGNNNFGSYNSASFVDSPATTSATTYQLFISCEPGSSTTIYINRSFNDGNGTTSVRGASSITLMEVSA